MHQMDMKPILRLGQVVVTDNATAQLSLDDIVSALRRHARGDWGEVGAYDRRNPDRARLDGCRVLSVYRAANGTRFWIISEADQNRTTVLLPEDH